MHSVSGYSGAALCTLSGRHSQRHKTLEYFNRQDQGRDQADRFWTSHRFRYDFDGLCCDEVVQSTIELAWDQIVYERY